MWTGLRDIARARPDEIATREIRGYRIEPRRNYPQLKGQICTSPPYGNLAYWIFLARVLFATSQKKAQRSRLPTPFRLMTEVKL